MATFSTKVNVQITPLETVTFEDGTSTAKIVHSLIDTVSTSEHEKVLGTTAGFVRHKLYTVTEAWTALNNVEIFGAAFSFSLVTLYIAVRTQDSTFTPTILVSLDSGVTYPFRLFGIGDVLLLQSDELLTTSQVMIKASTAEHIGKCDIMASGIA